MFNSHAHKPVSAAAYLRTLPPLTDLALNQQKSTACKMCKAPTQHFATVDFNKSCNVNQMYVPSGLPVIYLKCLNCEFIFTELCDDWTSTDYLDLIYNADYIKVDAEFTGSRAIRSAASLQEKLQVAKHDRLLDYGAGSGHFGDEMRRYGFQSVKSYDPFTMPDRPVGQFDVITSFDAIEHSARPFETLLDMLSLMADDGCLLIGQTLQPSNIDQLRGDWWYLAPRNGHVSLFSGYTLEMFANTQNLIFDNFGSMFSLSRSSRSTRTLEIIMKNDPVSRRVLLNTFGNVDGEPFGWHSLENEAGTWFRWTRDRDVSLGNVMLEGDVELVIPMFLAMSQDFVDCSSLLVGSTMLPLRNRGGKWLVTDFVSSRRVYYPIRLITPEPVETDVKDDHRRLGIAVMANVNT